MKYTSTYTDGHGLTSLFSVSFSEAGPAPWQEGELSAPSISYLEETFLKGLQEIQQAHLEAHDRACRGLLVASLEILDREKNSMIEALAGDSGADEENTPSPGRTSGSMLGGTEPSEQGAGFF
jgi:hypothetical protein